MPGLTGAAISVGDAVLNFFADTLELDRAFDRVNQDSKTKLEPAKKAAEGVGEALEGAGEQGQEAAEKIEDAWLEVAKATAENNKAQKELREALRLVRVTAGEDETAMAALARAQENASVSSARLAEAQKKATGDNKKSIDEGRKSFEQFGEVVEDTTDNARGSLDLLADQVGVRLPRELKGVISVAPAVSTALSLAFSPVVALALIQVTGQAIEKFREWARAGEIIEREWGKIDSEFRKTSLSIQDEINQQKQRFIELTEGPVAALIFALQTMRSEADKSASTIAGTLESSGKRLEDRALFLLSIFDPLKIAGSEMREFADVLEVAVQRAQDAGESKGDPYAGFREGVRLTQTEIDRLNSKLAELNKIGTTFKDPWEDAPKSNESVELLLRQIDRLKVAQEQFRAAEEKERERRKTGQEDLNSQLVAQGIAQARAEINAQREASLARISIRDSELKQKIALGQVGGDEEVRQLRSIENQKYYIETASAARSLQLAKQRLVDQQTELNKDPNKNKLALQAVNSQIDAIEAEHNGRMAALRAQHQLTLLNIDRAAYQQQAAEFAAGMQQLIAGAKLGTQERIDLEAGLAEFYRQTWGENSQQYQQQLQKVAAAERALADEKIAIASEQLKSQQALRQDQARADQQYYAYLVQTARATQGALQQIQRDAQERVFQQQLADMRAQLAKLGNEETAARTKLEGQIALVVQQAENNKRLAALQTIDAIDGYYRELGLKSADQWQREAAMAAEAYAQIAQSGASAFQTLSAEAAEYRTQAAAALARGDLESAKIFNELLALVEADIDKLLDKLGLLNREFTRGAQLIDNWAKHLNASRTNVQGFARIADVSFRTFADAAGSAFAQAILSQEAFGTALRKGLAAEVAVIASKALAWGLYFTAWGIADTFWNPARASADFASAAQFFAIAAVAGAAAYGVNPRGGKEGGGQQFETTPAEGVQQGATVQQAPVQQVNVPRFAAGALVTRPTLAVIGDAINGASASMSNLRSAREGVLPLDNPDALAQIGEALGPYIQGQQHVTNITNNFREIISDDSVHKFLKKINRQVKNNDVQLLSSNSFRVTRKS